MTAGNYMAIYKIEKTRNRRSDRGLLTWTLWPTILRLVIFWSCAIPRFLVGGCVIQLEQLERLRSEDTPAAPWLPTLLSHIGSQVKKNKVKVTDLNNLPKFPILKFWNEYYTRHTFWNCLIRFVNMKWIWRVLLKIVLEHVVCEMAAILSSGELLMGVPILVRKCRYIKSAPDRVMVLVFSPAGPPFTIKV